ncbi:NADP-dependent oxidoreductase domain-containing protein [Suillus clintonianus]|uniref:NADP-dependent oxidoreductase domain-containing protein n=1 Tax=Suillus clintonianus TaxID=1904413 RepID=UPI001B85EDD8|nr:NADP-dependent oxidoreductase domain-containing protein [Suillus clintonianus]KAG2142349.1 NADP-dependent oxidoreductase domain-containing protein [Suillus clintonianus]
MSHLIALNNGQTIPAVGFGTWQPKPNASEGVRAVEHALKAGYRHIDCAWYEALVDCEMILTSASHGRLYGNEKEVGEGLRASGVPREEVFLTSKVWGTYHRRVEECLDQTLANLGTTYVDLYLIHWPVALNPNGNHPIKPMRANGAIDIDESWDIRDTWKAMEAMVKKGKVKAIGVSNFSQMILEKILPTAEIIPVVNQLELHLYNPQLKLLDYLKSKKIVPQAYSPLGSTNAPLLTDETATEIAKKRGLKSTSDVLLGYLLTKDVIVLPKSMTPSRIESNLTGALEAYKVLTPDDLNVLDGIAASGKQKRFFSPHWGIDLGFDNWPAPTN